MFRPLITLLLCSCATPLGEKGVDTGAEGGASELSLVGTECDEGGVFDCDMECWETAARAYLGDSQCDDGSRGPNFDCLELNSDYGDCGSETTGDGSTTGSDTSGGTSGAGTGGGTGGGPGGGTGGGPGGGTGGGPGGGTGGTGGGTGGGTSGGGASGGTTGGTTGGSGSIGGACETSFPITMSNESGGTIFDAPAGSSGLYDCSLVCWPPEVTSETFTGSDGAMYVGSIGDERCDDGTVPAGSAAGAVAPNFNCVEWAYDGGDCP